MEHKEIWYNVNDKLPEKEGVYVVVIRSSNFKRISAFKNGKFSLDDVKEWALVSIEKDKK